MPRFMRFISLLGLGLAVFQSIGYLMRFVETLYLWWALVTLLLCGISLILWLRVPATRIYIYLLLLLWFGGFALSII